MIRQMMKLAVEAAKVEIDRWASPVQTPVRAPALLAPLVETVPAVNEAVEVVTAPKRHSYERMTAALKETTCPDCNEPKKVGWYRCPECTAISQAAYPEHLRQLEAADKKRRAKS